MMPQRFVQINTRKIYVSCIDGVTRFRSATMSQIARSEPEKTEVFIADASKKHSVVFTVKLLTRPPFGH